MLKYLIHNAIFFEPFVLYLCMHYAKNIQMCKCAPNQRCTWWCQLCQCAINTCI